MHVARSTVIWGACIVYSICARAPRCVRAWQQVELVWKTGELPLIEGSPRWKCECLQTRRFLNYNLSAILTNHFILGNVVYFLNYHKKLQFKTDTHSHPFLLVVTQSWLDDKSHEYIIFILYFTNIIIQMTIKTRRTNIHQLQNSRMYLQWQSMFFV